tara:strand:- start:1995 stop:2279 length:285 start_codon:yes stop_codon:yes gene_type:complete
MFNKEEKSTFNKDWGLDNKKMLEKSREVFIETPKPDKLNDVGSIVESIKENPEKSLTVNDCSSSLWSAVYGRLDMLGLHKRAKWDEESRVFKYR